MATTSKPATSFPTFDPNSEGWNRIYDMGEGKFPSNGFSTNSDALTNRIQRQALNSAWESVDPIDIAGYSVDNSVLGGLGSSFNSPVSNSNDFSFDNWGQGSLQFGDKSILNALNYNASNNNTSNNSQWYEGISTYLKNNVNQNNSQVNRYEGPSSRDKLEDAYITSQKAVADALVSNLGQSTAMGWAGFAVQAVQSVANIAMSIEQYKLGKKQFKQAKREYAYNVDKREQSIHDTLATRAEQGGLTGQAKEDWMASRGANANRY